MSEELKLNVNDPVKVDQKPPNQPLRGIVSYIGSVEFAEGDDWVGVRLTGASVGRGKNDGTVQGKTYFEVSQGAANGGVFVRVSHVRKVVLTKLESLRLKRELASSASPSAGDSVSGSVGSVSASARRRATPVKKATSNDDDDSSSVSSMRSSSTSATNRSRLDEIRQRRLDLQRNKNRLTSPPPKNKITAASRTPSRTPAKISSASASGSDANDNANALASTPARKIITSDSAPRSTAKKSLTPKSSPKAKSTSTTTTPTAPTPKSKPTSPRPPTHSPPKSPNKSTATATAELELNHLREKIKILQEHLQNKDKEMNDQFETLTEQIHMKDHNAMAAKGEMQSLVQQMDEKEKDANRLQEFLRKAEHTAHEAALAGEESKAEILELKRTAELEAEARGASAMAMGEADQEETAELKNQVADLLATNEILNRDKLGMEDNLSTTQRQNSSLQHELERERETHSEAAQSLRKEVTEARSHASVLDKELSQTTEKKALRDDNNASHYKERAKLQAEMLSWQRKVQEMANDKVEIESALEELALDKESLLEKNEELEDKFEEIKIDAESAQIEVDELRMELEDARERLEKSQATVSLGAAGGNMNANANADGAGGSSDADEVTQALSIQNARLREAIIRLREQTSIEKMEFTRQLRAVEKDSSLATLLKAQVEKLLVGEKAAKEEIKELTDMVDQGSAFEEMVEDLSERVLAVEDNNITLQSTIRELEEGGELSAEMEEAQAEEIKMLMMELQNRDTVVLNLEQAIKMQRRRELDFQRTVGNYRVTIETLQKEKQSLLEEMGGSDGVKEDAIIASQKALSQAAQSVAEASLARKKEAEASFNLIDAQVKSHLAERLEDFLPQGVASSEISAVKGELLLSKIAMKASLSLSSIGGIFEKSISNAKTMLNGISSAIGAPDKLPISNALAQEIGTMIHQTKFCQLAVEVSGECLSLLAAGQWPSLMSSEASMEMGTLIAHTVPELDCSISEQLLLLKKEGSLSPHQSNLNILAQSLSTTCSALKEAVDSSGAAIVPPAWSPPCLEALKSISSSKFNCFGAAAVLSLIITDSSDKTQNGAYMLKDSMTKVERFCSEISVVCATLAEVDMNDDNISENITSIATDAHKSTSELFATVEALCGSQEIHSSSLAQLDSNIAAASNSLLKMTSFIRSQQTNSAGQNQKTMLSPETVDPWASVVEAARNAQSLSADTDPLNYIVRGRNMEEQLSLAVENDAKLSIADAKIKSLEKNIATRSKEISMQNSRLQELETLLSQTPESTDPKSPQKPQAPTEEVSKLKEEIRVMNEAMDVVQGQVDEYEREIRSLKDQKSRSTRLPGSARKGASLETDFSLSSLGIGSPQKVRQDSARSQLSLESALFRPALRAALSDASMWKSKIMSDKLVELPPLSRLSSHKQADLMNKTRQLSLACAKVRHAKASIGIIKLGGAPSPRSLLVEERQKSAIAIQRLEHVSDTTRFSIALVA